MPTVSIIIPTFNREQFISQAIESVLVQSYKDFELIIIDDGSTDSTLKILKKYQNNISYYYQKNKGPGAARNLGIQQAKGEFITFLDSDDLWKKNKLLIEMDHIKENPTIKICYTDEIWLRNGQRLNPKKKHQKYSGWIFQKCLPLCIISPSSVIIHHSIFEKVGLFDENLIVCEDYDLWLRICARYPVSFINKPLIIKRGGHEDQLSFKYWGMDRYRITALKKIISENILNEQDYLAAVQMLKTKCRIYATGCLKRGKFAEAEKYNKMINNYIN